MTNQLRNFIQRLRGLSLSDNKKLAMRERLLAYTDLHPVLVPETAHGPLSSFFVFAASRRFSVYAASFLVLIIAGGSVTLAAEGTTPGDALYDVKININEPLMTILAPTDAGQARVAARIATRRADEAVQLATRGTLTEERRAYLSERLTQSVQKAVEKADKVATGGDPKDAETVKANLAAGLAGEAQALGAIATGETDGDKTRAESLLAVVVASGDQLGDSRDAVGFSGDMPNGEGSHKGASSLTSSGLLSGASTTLSTTTPGAPKAFLGARFTYRLRITATTTLDSLRAKRAFGNVELLSPKVDSALPGLPRSGSLGGVGDVGQVSGDGIHD